jgi:drug/metabolite transporter (DMT)-like permease
MRLPAKYLVGCGALFVGYMLLVFLAIGQAADRQQVLEVGLINYLWPVLTLVLSVMLLGKKANWLLFPGTLIALAGIYLVVTQGASLSWQSPVANSLALAAAVSWALYSNLTRRWVGGREEGAVVLFLPVTALVLILLSVLLDEPRLWSSRALAEALFLGIATYAGYMLWDNAMRRGNVVLVAAVSYMTPFLSTVVSSLYLAIVPGARLWIGCGILILGSVLSWLSVSDSSRRKQS